jgi:Ala-tRNA(Pro) deacylase
MLVPQFLTDRDVRFETMLHPPAFTAQKLAKYLHVPGRYVVKSVLLVGEGGFYLAVLPAPRQVDLDAIARELGSPVRLAGTEEIVERFPGCEWGALTPFGHLYNLTTLLDASIPSEGVIVFEAGQHMVAIRMTASDYLRLENPRRFAFARPVSATTKRPPAM